MLVSTEACIPILLCPRTKETLKRTSSDTEDFLESPTLQYRFLNGQPILIDFSDSVLSEDSVFASAAGSPIERKKASGLMTPIKRLLSPQKSTTRNNVRRLVADLQQLPEPARVLIVGGGTIGQGMAPLYEHPRVQLYSFDVYGTELTQFVADAHHMPLPDDFFDAVVIQAVLEHVLQPAQVVSEIWRVLRPAGLVYAETPFMQQVHEGPYDFTRFTESGHRYLFRHFAHVASGASGGPGIQFMWAADYLARSVLRSATAGKIAKLAFFWTQYLDALIPAPYGADGASGVYFYGRKSQTAISPRDIINYYQGAQR
ncbi:class I SAM-dependent methyltransferase [Ensifer adhaerens]|uniref:class I SAM-dependent methyltransferase n=1 Tax=Ensifer adhaerens TaxID=106592 RepID=UPI000CF06799|nr:class I SAM-dependent methyltransferase [Ensifer adhaerens]